MGSRISGSARIHSERCALNFGNYPIVAILESKLMRHRLSADC